jgi:hypothetical protein
MSKLQQKRFTTAIDKLNENSKTLELKIEDAKVNVLRLEEKRNTLLATIKAQRKRKPTTAQREELQDIIAQLHHETQFLNRLRVERGSTAAWRDTVRSSLLTLTQREHTKKAIGKISTTLGFNVDRVNKDIEREAAQRDNLNDVNENVKDTLDAVSQDEKFVVEIELDKMLEDLQKDGDDDEEEDEEEEVSELRSMVMKPVVLPRGAAAADSATPTIVNDSDSPRSPSASSTLELLPTSSTKKPRGKEKEKTRVLLDMC